MVEWQSEVLTSICSKINQVKLNHLINEISISNQLWCMHKS